MFKRTVLLVTHDEHGGLYDHVPPPTGVPSPGGAPSSVGRLMRLLLYRKARAFDFTMLGPRVPAVVISPLVPAGIVDPQTHDHASIPATLRRLFAPGASPLTRRDAWSAPFHGLLTLPVARTDLPDLSDLSAYATGLTAAVSTAAVSTPSAAAAPRPSNLRLRRRCPRPTRRSPLSPSRSSSIWSPSVNRRRPAHHPPADRSSGVRRSAGPSLRPPTGTATKPGGPHVRPLPRTSERAGGARLKAPRRRAGDYV